MERNTGEGILRRIFGREVESPRIRRNYTYRNCRLNFASLGVAQTPERSFLFVTNILRV